MSTGASPIAVPGTEPEQPNGCPAFDRAGLVLRKLLAAHEAWFDVTHDFEVAGRTFPGYAAFHSLGERYVLVKRAKLWEVGTHEHLFFDIVDRFDEDMLARAVDFMKTEALKLVEPAPNHMCSNISLVVIANALDGDVERAVRKVRFRKNFKWGLWGWSDLRVAVVDLSEGLCGRILTNAAGKTLRATLEANLVPAAHED